METSTVSFVSGIINIILVLVTLFFIYLTLRVMLILGPREVRKSMMFPILIAGILLLPMAGTELFRDYWSGLAILHSVFMLLVVFTLTFGIYSYYRMLKKSYAWEAESQKS
jgi:hypothetical protein